MQITHSLRDGCYDIAAGNKLVAIAVKTFDGFDIEWAAFTEAVTSFKTMRDLKQAVDADLPDWARKSTPNNRSISVAKAKMMLGLSHNGIRAYISTIRDLWPQTRARAYGPLMLRMGMEYQASWGVESARLWLERNQTVGQYDADERIAREIELGWRDEDMSEFLPIAESLIDYD